MNNFDAGFLINRLSGYRPRRVILFGSAAAGSAGPDSDIDIAIIKDTDRPFYRRAADVRKLLRSRTPLDVFVFTPAEFALAKKPILLLPKLIGPER